jgi:hypothetical protein
MIGSGEICETLATSLTTTLNGHDSVKMSH